MTTAFEEKLITLKAFRVSITVNNHYSPVGLLQRPFSTSTLNWTACSAPGVRKHPLRFAPSPCQPNTL